ncbi:MAG: diacylglycerol kinase family protein [Oligoflexales bacterium]
MVKIAIIANPHAKSNRLNPVRLQKMADDAQGKALFCATQSLEQLNETTREIGGNRFDYLLISGGDGTISRTLSSLAKVTSPAKFPHIVPLADGTINVLCCNLRIKARPISSILSSLLADSFRRKTAVSTIEIDGNLGFVYGDGFITSVLEMFYRNKDERYKQLTKLGARLFSAALLKQDLLFEVFKRSSLSYEVDGVAFPPIESMGALVTTLPKLPFNLPFWGPSIPGAGGFSGSIIKCPPEKLLWYLAPIMLQKKIGTFESKVNFHAKRLELLCDTPPYYTIDGELFSSQQKGVCINSGPSFTFTRV